MEKFIYSYRRRGIETHSEVVCQAHRDEMSVEGGFMAPLSIREKAAGLEQRFTPYKGARPCASCAELADVQQAPAMSQMTALPPEGSDDVKGAAK